ncbi:hypothetical protein [Sphingopyxis sp.]|uniref:hypothetical protein n=1 Tax=Sphingopyxis sp. TaxID=1908224 RepID=UPI00261E2968|nr:hypothetical protein [Sphingopyxis sp.]MCW0197513.1 hypothetical protein [Sphingopyxis sp.]
MRAFLIASALVAALPVAPAVAADPPLVPIAPEEATAPSLLVPLAPDSPWTARFAAAADELLPALRSEEQSRWVPLLGGAWLGAPDRARVAALLRDGPFREALFAGERTQRIILGWQPPATLNAADRAAIAARPEAEAIVCWAAQGAADPAWPRTAREADNAPGRPYACARIAYSVRDGASRWRAFVERG